MNMRLALWQGAGVAGDIDATIAETARIAKVAQDAGADMLVFPEGFLTGYFVSERVLADLSKVENALQELAEIAG